MAENNNDIRGQKIKELVEEMKLYNNPQELEDMRKLMRKNVPLMMRGYLLAYLYVKSNATAKTARPAREQRADRPERTALTERPERKQQPKPGLENAVSFYINVGKASKGSAHEMVDFICEKTGLSSEDILSVAYKQNYSFVYISKDKAEGIIEAVTGQTYKGRKVKMNYSKEKDEQ
ncbi:MAG: DbpA RNA binding domain-containing protein [Spirochaetales bacterium]|nr:DbpA RNA binding domain-containing protein [Spirochaetales bacterium]